MKNSLVKKKGAIAVFAGVLALGIGALALTGCSSNSSSSSDDKTITVAAVPTPHAEVLNNAVAPILEKDGYTLVVKEFTDYVQPNTVTENGDVDANYFQHKPYLDNFNEEQGTHLVSVEGIHFEPMGVYSNGNYAIAAGFKVNTDALAVESAESEAAQTYANLLVVKEGNENSDKTKELAKALNSSEVRDYINATYEGAVVPVF